MTLRIDPILPADVDAVREMQVAAWTALAAAAHTPEQTAAHTALIRSPDYAEALLSNNLLIARRDGHIVGSAGWCPVPNDLDAARIRKVFVHPSEAGTGLGRRLVESAEAASGRPRFTVRSNANAERFYAALGYVPVERGTMPAMGVDLPVVFMAKG